MRCFASIVIALTLACGHDSATKQEAGKPTVRDPQGSIKLLLHAPGKTPTPRDACDVELCSSLLELIRGAEDTIEFAVYGVRSQRAIADALVAAKQRGVLVRGIVDRDAEGKNYYADTDALVQALGNVHDDQAADAKLARRESRWGEPGPPRCERPAGTTGPVQCLAYDLGDKCLLAAHASREPMKDAEAIMHDKFFVIDNRFVWTGSTNVSDSCAGGYNANLVTVVDSPRVAGWYKDEFEQMWGQGRYHQLKQSHGELRAELGDSDIEVMFSPQDSPIRARVRPLIKRAKRRIDIAVFFLTHKHITEDLIAAHRRGVAVRVILDATAAQNGYTKHELLRAAGVPVKVENWGGKMHMKSAAIDGEVVITGSMNWTSAGEGSNDENTIIVTSRDHAAQYHAFFEQVWRDLPVWLLEDNPDPESKASGTSCSDGVDNDFDDAVDADDPGCGENPPALPALPSWSIVPKGERLTCETSMSR